MLLSTRTLTLCTAPFLALVLAAVPRAKADTLYTSSSYFNSATTGRTTIDFNGIAAPGANYSIGANVTYTNGDVSFLSPGPASITSTTYVYFDTPAYGSDYFAMDYGSPDEVTITFPSATAVGFNTGGIFGDPSSIMITLSDGTTQTFITTGDSTAAGHLNFYGFTTTTAITSVTIVYNPPQSGNSFGALDNFTYGAALPLPPTPEPGSLGLLGTGAAGVLGVVRRKRRV